MDICTGQPAQKEALVRERTALDKEIASLRQQLQHTNGALGSVSQRQEQLRLTIARREQLVAGVIRQAALISEQISGTTADVRQLEARLRQLKHGYAQSMIYAYKKKNGSGIVGFVFAPGSFNEALQRLQYARKYRENRIVQMRLIRQYNAELTSKVQALASSRSAHTRTIEQQQAEMRQLQTEKQQLGQQAAQWQQKRKAVQAGMAVQMKKRLALQRRIARFIQLSQRDGGKPVLPHPGEKNGKPTLTAETVTGISGKKGKLPCPVDNGYVFMKFGVYKLGDNGPEGNNEFLSIGTAAPGLPVKAVYRGTVKAVTVLEEDNTSMVMLDHGGGYYTVYANLGRSAVSKGQVVMVGQVLGVSGPNEDKPGAGLLEFMMLKDGTTTMNPSVWVGCR